MPLHDYNIANQTPANYRSDHNNLNLAIAGNNASSSGITTTYAHMWYADVSSSGWMRQRNAADSTFNYLYALGQPGGVFTTTQNPSSQHAAKFQGQFVFDTSSTSYYYATLAGTSSQATWSMIASSSAYSAASVSAASSSEMEADTSTEVTATPGKFKYHPAAIKGWFRFAVSSSGGVTLSTSYQVSSITDNGVGDYSVNFSSPFSSVNYACGLAAGNNSTAGIRFPEGPQGSTTPQSTASYRFIVFDNAFSFADSAVATGIFSGDL